MNVLITGATSGIGEDLAKTLAYFGYNVYACCHTDKELMYKSSNIKNLNYIKFDISNVDDYKNIDKYNIDVLVNQAGICVGGSFLDIEQEKLEENFKINVFSTIRLTKYFIDYCYSNGKKGKVLVTSSLIDGFPACFLGSYALTKCSLTMFTKILKKELKKSCIDVSVKLIRPGAYKTGFNQLMIDDIIPSKYFRDSNKIHRIYKILFDILEKKNNRTVVNKMVIAIKDNSNRLIYSVPFAQNIPVKIYKVISTILEK